MICRWPWRKREGIPAQFPRGLLCWCQEIPCTHHLLSPFVDDYSKIYSLVNIRINIEWLQLVTYILVYHGVESLTKIKRKHPNKVIGPEIGPGEVKSPFIEVSMPVQISRWAVFMSSRHIFIPQDFDINVKVLQAHVKTIHSLGMLQHYVFQGFFFFQNLL